MFKDKIVIETVVNKPIEEVWKIWNDTKDILNWYHANDEWE